MNRKLFWIILAMFHGLFFIKQVFFNNSLIQDSVEYLFAADNLIQKGTLYAWNMNFAFNADWLTKRPFLYPSILVMAKTLSGGSSFLFFFLIYLVQNLLSLNTIRLCLNIADKYNPLFSRTKVLLFLLFSISQVIYANLIMCEIWLQAALFGIAYLLIMKEDSIYKYLYISLLIIAGMALKPVLMPAAFLFPIALIIYYRKQIKWLYLTISILPIIFAISYSLVNKQRTGYAQYSSISTINLLHYNSYVMLMNEYGTTIADSLIDNIKINTRGMSYAQKQQYIEENCKTLIKDHLSQYTYLHLRGIAFALFDPGRFDITQFFNLPHEGNLIYQTNQNGLMSKLLKILMNPLGIVLLSIFVFNLFRFLRICLFIAHKGYTWPLKLIILLVPTYILALTGPIGTSRFFMPLIPFGLLVFILSYKSKKT
ncbi:MAG: hypothetical protein IT245_03135 [Bacteroidia bacterium]|nr:hypothetical protein [Bacteroidia bacterium]